MDVLKKCVWIVAIIFAGGIIKTYQALHTLYD